MWIHPYIGRAGFPDVRMLLMNACIYSIYGIWQIQFFFFYKMLLIMLLAHLSRRLKVSYCDHSPSVVVVVVRLSVRSQSLNNISS